MAIKIDVDVSGINETIDKLKKMPYKLEKVRDRALVRAKDMIITASKEAIRQRYTINATAARDALKTHASISADKLEIVFKGRPITPIRFQHTPRTIPALTPKGKRKKYVPTVTIFPKEKKTLKKQRGDDGKMYPVFLAPTGTKSSEKIPSIFFTLTGRPNKQGEKNRKMKAIKTVSVPQMMTNKHVMPQIQKAAAEAFMKRFEHEAKRILEGKG